MQSTKPAVISLVGLRLVAHYLRLSNDPYVSESPRAERKTVNFIELVPL